MEIQLKYIFLIHLILLSQGNFQQAIEFYTLALDDCSDGSNDLESTLLSNRAMCQLKLAEVDGGGVESMQQQNIYTQPAEVMNRRKYLQGCIDDCTLALGRLYDITANNDNKSNNNLSSRGKILYRRAKAFVAMNYNTDDEDVDATEKCLNAAAKDLLQLLSFDPNNKEGVSLLRTVRSDHGKLGGGIGRSRISRSLDYLRSLVVNDVRVDDFVHVAAASASDKQKDKEGVDPLSCMRILQSAVAEDTSSSAEDIGRRNGVPLLLQIAKCGIAAAAASSDVGTTNKTKSYRQEEKKKIDQPDKMDQCRFAAIQILSACCSHEPFVVRYAGRDSLPPCTLTQIIEKEASLSSIDDGSRGNGSADLAVAVTALLIRLVVHWHHSECLRFFAQKILEDGSIEEKNVVDTTMKSYALSEVDSSSICQVVRAAFSWGGFTSTNSDLSGGSSDFDTRPPRAALDLLSAWTASDLDALDAAWDACLTQSTSASTGTSYMNSKKASQHRITPEEIRKLKPRQVAAHRKREAEYHQITKHKAIQCVSIFCNAKNGGLDAMLSCASRTNDHRLRRELGLQLGRLISVYEDNDDLKKLMCKELGCTNWKIGVEDGDQKRTLSALTIDELDVDEDKEEEERSASELFDAMKRGQLTASLLLGKAEVGSWALKHGWSDGNGVEELKRLISSNDSRAMSIASELVSAASSIESTRPLLVTLVEKGSLDDLLIHPDADVRSGAASCAAKIGLSNKSLSADEGEVMGLLDVAIDLLFEDEDDDLHSNVGTESTSMDRGIEVLVYLVSKTYVKEKIASGYMPDGPTSNHKSALQRLVELGCDLGTSDSQIAYGIASIFNLVAVSIETLRKEAFIGKDITQEQYDQLQALGKTEEEKEASSKLDRKEGDDPSSVRERIQKLANANVSRALVKLLEGSSSDATQEKLLEGMGRMASESSVRGIMIQQGCLTACLRLDKGDKPNETEKKILRQARCCVAKLLVTTNPGVLTASQRTGSVGPLLKLVKDSDALDLHHFEALMALTNLAGFDNETKNRVVAQQGISILSYAMFSDHEMVRQAATEAMCNMVPHPEFMDYLTKDENIRVWVAFSMDYEANFGCARAAIGLLAMAVPDPEVANALVKTHKFDEMIRSLLECGQLQLMHRLLALVVGLIEYGGKCREAVVTSGAGPFCKAYLASFSDEKKTIDDFNFSIEDRGSLSATLSLAKEVVNLLF